MIIVIDSGSLHHACLRFNIHCTLTYSKTIIHFKYLNFINMYENMSHLCVYIYIYIYMFKTRLSVHGKY